jgi:hypothetical protein
MDSDILKMIVHGWAQALDAVGLSNLVHSSFGVTLVFVLAAFAVSGAARAIIIAIAGARQRRVHIERRRADGHKRPAERQK